MQALAHEDSYHVFRRLYQGALALIAWFALALQLYLIIVTLETSGGSIAAGVVRYFSFFTVTTNLIIAVTTTIIVINRHTRAARSLSRPVVQTGIAAWIALVCITYEVILRSLWHPTGLQFLADVLLHDVVPILYVVYWAAFVHKGHLRSWHIFMWMIYPALYAIYALVRGEIVHEYPYPFLDAGKLGYFDVSMNAVYMMAAFLILASIFVAIDRMVGRRR